jgi:preprotein translocase subunit SecF
MELIRPGIYIDFMRQRKFWIFLSTFLSVSSLILAIMPEGLSWWKLPGPNYGTDFRGGTELEVTFKKPIDVGTLRSAVESVPGFSRPDVVSVGNPGQNRYLIRVQEHSSLDQPTMFKVRSALCYRGAPSDPDGNPVACGGKKVCDAGFTCDASLKQCVDAPIDEQRCNAEVLKANEVKFSPGGDKVGIRFEVKQATDLVVPPCPTSGEKPEGCHEGVELVLQPKVEQEVVAAITNSGVQLRGTAQDVSVKGKEGVQSKDFRVEVQLKSKGDVLLDQLRSKLGADMVPLAADKVEWVGPRAGKQLRDAAVKSVLFAIIFIMAYVAFRFDLRFAPGGILALFHDALVVIGVFIILRREISLSTIAAILTIVGYSMSDTVIIYDRIRENLAKHRGKTFHEIINLSVSETLGRTIVTSGSVLLSVAAFFIYGTGVIKDFALALFVGVIAGTYSSIFVAAPLTEYIDRKWFGATATKLKKPKSKAGQRGPGGAKHQAQHQL